MTLEADSGILGISLIHDQLRIVEGAEHSNEFQISKIANGRVRQPFSYDVFSDKNIARRFAEDITRLYEGQEFTAKEVAFSLDSQMVLIKTIPIDKELPESKIEEQVNWEVRQFSISPTNEYIIDYERTLSEPQNGAFNHLLVVVVRKQIVRYLRQVFNHTDLRLKVIDVDVFSAQRALELNYDYQSSDKIGLIEIEERKAHFSILSDRNYYLSEDIELPSNSSESEQQDETAARVISKELRRIILEQQIGKGPEDLSEIILYGEAVEDQVLEELQKNHDLRIHRANPFKRIVLTENARNEINQERAERFMISVGAALRGIQ